MRQDMARVIVERPRVGGGYTKGQNKNCRDLEDLPTRESMRRRHKERKELNENLAPLRRYLERNVGRPWNKVFSEICEHIRVTSAVQKHVRDHVQWEVETNTFLGDDGRVYDRNPYGPICLSEPCRYSRPTLYVHPKSGLLCIQKRGKSRKYRQNQKATGNRVVSPNGQQLHKVKGTWYVVTLAKIPNDLYTEQTFVDVASKTERKIKIPTKNGAIVDKIIKRRLFDLTSIEHYRYRHYDDATLRGTYGRDDVYAVNVKQANSQELSRAGVKNDPQPETPTTSGKERRSWR